jgi:putative acetyltransferase
LTSDITLATAEDHARLLEIWEASVRATHLFLAEENIQTFIPLVKQEIAEFSPIHCLRDAEGAAVAYMGVADAKIEMLFASPDCRGLGMGRKLVEYAIQQLGANHVDVNEQNLQAVGFYQHMGFKPIARSELDPFGNPFPVLHLKLSQRNGGDN